VIWAWLEDPLVTALLGALVGVVGTNAVTIWVAKRQNKAVREEAAARREERRTSEAAKEDKAAREEIDKRDRIKESVMAEARRIEAEAMSWRTRLPGTPDGKLPGGLQSTNLLPIIESSALLRGELEGMALLDSASRARLQGLAGALNDYNAHIKALPGSEMRLISKETLALLDRLIELA
jgi:hypothetical protein